MQMVTENSPLLAGRWMIWLCSFSFLDYSLIFINFLVPSLYYSYVNFILIIQSLLSDKFDNHCISLDHESSDSGWNNLLRCNTEVSIASVLHCVCFWPVFLFFFSQTQKFTEGARQDNRQDMQEKINPQKFIQSHSL